jgi:translation initiation factor IF-2
VEVLGLQGTPMAGDRFAVVENEARAREIAEYRQRLAREKAVARQTGSRGSLEQMMTQLQTSGVKEFPLVIKGDVQGSIEAIIGALDKLGTDEVRARVVHSGAGGITESDISLPRPPTPRSSPSTCAPTSRPATPRSRTASKSATTTSSTTWWMT